ncbi:MAG: FkbM family methyltransferase [Anaerolineae bacterium]
MATSADKLNEALAFIGRDATTREEITRSLHVFEERTTYSGSLRDEVTGVVFDALYRDAGLLQKRVQSGLVFEFYHTSKITRDFILSTPETPDHVWEPQTTRLLLYLAQHTHNVVIGGAYFGDQALLVAQQLAAHHGVCHAFEPNSHNFKLLVRNAESNGLTHVVRPHQLGLWNEITHLHLVGDDAYAFSAPTEETAEDGFATTTIDAYARQQGIENQIGLIMLDTEGGELRALQGAEQHLALPAGQAPHLVFEVHRHYVDWTNGLNNTEVLQFLMAHGYKVFAVRDYQSNQATSHLPIELIPPQDTYLEGPPHGFNMLAVKDETVIQNDLFRIRHHVSPKLLLHKDPALHHPLP